MTFNDIMKESWLSISGNKIRSFLTVLGIVIGVMAVVIMVAVGETVSKQISDQFSSLGTNTIMIRAGAAQSAGVRTGNRQTLTTQDNVTRKNAAGSEYTINYNGYKARLAGAQELADMVKNKPTEDGTIWNASTYSFIHAMPVWLYANLGRPTPSADSLFIPTRPIPRTTAPYG